MVHKLIVPKKRLLIMYCHSSYFFVTFFQFVRHHTIELVCLPLYAARILQGLYIMNLEPLPNMYCLEPDECQQAGNRQIN